MTDSVKCGIRIGKNSGGVVTEYILNGTLILAEKHGDTVIRYIYDENGLPVGMILDGTPYLYEKNLQGDVIGIYTTAGTKVAWYYYDAWGKVLRSSYRNGYIDVCRLNPFRYRGYYYDTETGFYYLQSRYYDPTVGRFLNADGYINANGDLQGFNMYAYCSNNPVMYVDYEGELAIWLTAIIVTAVIVATIGLDHYVANSSFNGEQLIKDNNGNALDERILYIEGNGFECDEKNGITLCDFQAVVYDGYRETNDSKLSMTKFLSYEAVVQADISGEISAEASAIASIYTMYGEYSFSFWGVSVNIAGSLNVGAVGGGFGFNLSKGKGEFTIPSFGIVPSFSIDLDFE